MSGPRHVVVIGGGVIGAACAHWLLESGWRVTLLEAGKFGAGCSHANCGFVCPSHVLPLAEPGAVKKALRALLSRNSAFSIKPRFDPALWRWLWNFARRCNRRDMLSAGRACAALLQSSMSLYRELMETEGLDCEWETRGLLFVYRTQKGMDSNAATDELLRGEFGISGTRYDGEAVRELEPALKPGLAGGWHYEDDAHLRPDKLMSAWRRRLEDRGATIRENRGVRRFMASGGKLHAVGAADLDIAADAFVLATGAWTSRLTRLLGLRLPIQPGKGYSLTMPRPTVCPKIPLLFPEVKVAATPMRSGYRLGSTMEFAGYDDTLRPQRLELLKSGAKPYLQEPYCEPVEEAWFGWRPMTYDGVPIIGRAPALKNLWIAAGHNMLGLSMAPATGKLIAELLDGRPPHVPPDPYRPERF